MSGLTVYTAAEAAAVAKCKRTQIDGACASGALVASDATPDSTKHRWRILERNLEDWIERGYPANPADEPAA